MRFCSIVWNIFSLCVPRSLSSHRVFLDEYREDFFQSVDAIYFCKKLLMSCRVFIMLAKIIFFFPKKTLLLLFCKACYTLFTNKRGNKFFSKDCNLAKSIDEQPIAIYILLVIHRSIWRKCIIASKSFILF